MHASLVKGGWTTLCVVEGFVPPKLINMINPLVKLDNLPVPFTRKPLFYLLQLIKAHLRWKGAGFRKTQNCTLLPLQALA